MTDKETSARVSSIASRIINMELLNQPAEVASHSAFQSLLEDAKTLAGSCMSQDETPGQQPGPGPHKIPTGDFLSRLKEEREDLDRRLTALNSFLTHNPGHPNARHFEMLRKQATIMSEFLSVLEAKDAAVRANLPAPGFGEKQRVASQPELGEPREVGGHDEDRDGPVPFGG